MGATLQGGAERVESNTVNCWNEQTLREQLEGVAFAEAASPPPRRAAVAIVLALSNAPRVLLMRRSLHPEDPWSGQISLPGGGRDPGDADLLATALRETREEVSVDLAEDGDLLGRLAPIQARARGQVLAMDVSPFVFTLRREVEVSVNEEAEEAFWFPLDRAAKGELDHSYLYHHTDGSTRELPGWIFEKRVVWGMTHHILSDLLGLMRS